MTKKRIKLYKQLEKARNSKVIAYATSTRTNIGAQIAPDMLSKFLEHLDEIGDTQKITLFLYTNGGIITAAWSLVNLIRSFCKELEVIIPANCFSAGTLICLGADNLVMTKQAMLGPIDPSINSPFNPKNGNTNFTLPLSVEHINAYIEMAKKDVGIRNQTGLAEVLMELSKHISPIALGNAYKSRAQIQMLAHKLLNLRKKKILKAQENIIIKFLCSESGSHDYSICRKEARDYLKLPVESPSMELYRIIKEIYNDIKIEMELETPFSYEVLAQSHSNFSCKRVIVESLYNNSDIYYTDGTLQKAQNPTTPASMTITYEGWKHE